MQRSFRLALATVCGALLLSGCEATGCTLTQTEAHPASVVDPLDVAASAVLNADLRAEGAGLSTKTIEFRVRQGEELRLVGEATTDAQGRATLDLKSRPGPLVRGTLADEYQASFDGDATYCSSADESEIKVANL